MYRGMAGGEQALTRCLGLRERMVKALAVVIFFDVNDLQLIVSAIFPS